MDKFLEQYDKEYEFLYNNDGFVCGYDEAVEWFDKHQNDPEVKKYVDDYVKARRDFISSDREAAAFAFTCEVFNIGKEE